ncbi:hypothetical protein AGOR_G00166820 [Albula goreensis]|uniref:Adrenomedullin n=1 Tax=Albula goreensis TaxID=1534307 RepID=A0A8T3D088_9TELE|nr:hypothetical protein AGOR_G00166820 [Albula goreensis]
MSQVLSDFSYPTLISDHWNRCHSCLTALHSSLGGSRTLDTCRLSLSNLTEWIIEKFSFPTKMKLQTFFCCWLLASFVPGVDSAKLDLSSVLKKRLSTWLQSRTKRDLSDIPAAIKAESMTFVQPEDVKDTLKPYSSTDIIIRAKRTKNSVNQSKRAGCSFLPTCTVHNLAHRIHQFSNKIDNAPPDKISPIGYGRRRRSLPEHMPVLLLEHGRLRLVKGEEARMPRRKSQVFNRRT